jgi:riboflavin kinase / FMN adenylyltransferase
MPDAPQPIDESGLPDGVDATVLTVGTFDGLHVGHRDVIGRLVDHAAKLTLPSLLVTFEPHPASVLRPDVAPRLLTVWPEKLEILAELGLDYVAVLRFTRALAALAPDEFVDRILLGRFRMYELLMGYDHGFGRNRSGDAEVLRALGRSRGFKVEVVPPVAVDGGKPVSSSSIRVAISEGRLPEAAAALGRRYGAFGRVVHGEQRGRLLGFPTLNIELPTPDKLLPPEGVYAVVVHAPRGAFGGMMNLGPRPTFGDARVGLEAHLFDAAGDWYGAEVRVDFVARLRDTQRFPSVDALVEQLHRDAVQARQALAATGSG